MYSLLVLGLGQEPGYVLDRMELYEIRALLKHQHRRNRESWEQTRMLAYVMARCAGNEMSDVKEIFRLPWDEEEEKVEADPLKEAAAIERMKEISKALISSGELG